MSEVGTCGECGRDDVPVNPSSKTLRKHTFDGEPCSGSGGEPAAPETAEVEPPAEDDQGAGSDPAADDVEDDGDGGKESDNPDNQPDNSSGDQAPPAAPQHVHGAVEQTDGGHAYCWQMTVKNPAIYLGDAEWHYANGEAALAAAVQAGHEPTGEAHWDGAVGGGYEPGTVLLTYLVPVAQ